MSAAYVSPQNLDAEDDVLGAILLSGKALEAAAEEVEPSDFYGLSNGRIFETALALHASGTPVDAITLAAELDRLGLLSQVGGTARIHVLAALGPPTANVRHHARLVREAGQRYRLIKEVGPLLDKARNGGFRAEEAVAVLERARQIVSVRRAEPRFPGLSHEEALAYEVPEVRQLVSGLVEAGTVGTIAGVPGTHKSFLAVEVAFKVVTGGTVLGREVLLRGPVGYWWQDDSEANEAARLQDYACCHGHTGPLPLRWHLNEGLRLPEDMAALREEVEREGQALLVLDSIYNFLPGVSLKDEEAAAVFRQLKAEVCDPTGAAILVIDHAPWPSETNRGARRAYGSVFKAAAIRWSIFLERDAGKLYVEAAGNNLPALARQRVDFDADVLELRLAEEEGDGASLGERIAVYLGSNHGAPIDRIAEAVQTRRTEVKKKLEEDPRFHELDPPLGEKANARCWTLVEVPVPDDGTGRDGQAAEDTTPSPSHDPYTPKGWGAGRAEVVSPSREPVRADEGKERL